MHESILAFKGSRYGWWALLLSALCLGIYLSQSGLQVPNGGTWQGYVLGTIATLLIVWLTALGIRKRRYSSSLGSVQGWTSAHVYLGIAVLFIATLHCAVQFGWNVHTLAYLLMAVVILSGFVGLYVYTRYPMLISNNRAGKTTNEMFAELNELNQQGVQTAQRCDPVVLQVVDSCISRTTIGGGLMAQLRGLDNSKCLLPSAINDHTSPTHLADNKDQQAAINYIASCIPRTRKKHEASELQKLLTIVCRRQTILRHIRRDIQLRAGLKIWLLVHIPATMGLLVSLCLHIIAVFFFW